MAAYGFVLLMSAFAWWLLQGAIVRAEGPDSLVAKIYAHDLKGKISPVLYVAGMIGSLSSPWIGGAFYVGVALMWLVPDRRVEREFERIERAE